jgi:prepilin-type N-terminal cleavage/methylation domain-containing protein
MVSTASQPNRAVLVALYCDSGSSMAMCQRSNGNPKEKRCCSASGDLGFSLLESLIVVAIIAVMTAIAIPNGMRVLRTFAIKSDAESIMGLINTARMRAAADFARTEVTCNSTISTCSILVATYKGIPNPLSSDYVSDKQTPAQLHLSAGVSIAAPSGVSNGVAGQSGSSPVQGGTPCSSCAYFNSRGFPVDASGSPFTGYAFYLQDSKYGMTMAVGIDISGKAAVYQLGGNTWTKIAE